MNRHDIIDKMCFTWRHDYGLERPDSPVGFAGLLSAGLTQIERQFIRKSMEQIFDNCISPHMVFKEVEETEKEVKVETIYVICYSYEEFRQLGYKEIVNDGVKHKFVSDVSTLKGLSCPNVIFVGTWVQRPDIESIITQVKISQRKFK